MESFQKKKEEADFDELLARYIWGELDYSGIQRLYSLKELYPEFQNKFSNLKNLEQTLSVYFPDKDSLQEEETNGKKRYFVGLLATAAVFLLTIGGGLFYYNKSFLLKKPVSAGVLTRALGSCNNAPLSERGVLKSGAESVCEFQFRNSARTLIRLYPDSRIYFQKSGRVLELNLEQGQVMVDSQKLAPGENLELRSSGISVKFLGTQVFLSRNADGSVETVVLKGRVKLTRGNQYHLEQVWRKLTPEQKLTLGSAFPTVFKMESLELGPEHSLRNPAPSKRRKAVLRRVENQLLGGRGVQQVLKENWQEELKRELDALSPEDRSAVEFSPRALRKSPMTPQIKVRFRKGFELLERVSLEDKQDKQLSPEGRIKEERKSALIMKNVLKPELPDYIQKLVLKDGRVLEGVVYEEGNQFIVLTRKGRKSIPAASVEEVEIIVIDK